jgi:transcriptional regulator with XRE-family HTH domain
MVHNPEKLEQATYYRKQGFSYTEIAALCDVSKSTVSNWFKGQAFSKKITAANASKAAHANKARISLLNKARQREREKRYKDIERSALVEYRHYKQDPLFTAGLMAYVAAGDVRSDARVRVTSSHSTVHKVFLAFLRKYTDVPKSDVKFWLLRYSSMSERQCVDYWSKQLKLKAENYYKHQVVPGKSQFDTLQYGVGNTIIGSIALKKKLLCWIDLLAKEWVK